MRAWPQKATTSADRGEIVANPHATDTHAKRLDTLPLTSAGAHPLPSCHLCPPWDAHAHVAT
eukprot:3049404-Pyramimonas_sp.AAC.1